MEQVGVGSCPKQHQVRAFHPVDQQPVRFNVHVTTAFPLPLERVIAVSVGQRRLFNKQAQELFKSSQILAALFDPLQITFEGSGGS